MKSLCPLKLGGGVKAMADASSKNAIFFTCYGKTHIKKKNFSGRTTKRVGRVNPPPWPISKKLFFSLKSGYLAQKLGRKKSKILFQAIIRNFF